MGMVLSSYYSGMLISQTHNFSKFPITPTRTCFPSLSKWIIITVSPQPLVSHATGPPSEIKGQVAQFGDENGFPLYMNIIFISGIFIDTCHSYSTGSCSLYSGELWQVFLIFIRWRFCLWPPAPHKRILDEMAFCTQAVQHHTESLDVVA